MQETPMTIAGLSGVVLDESRRGGGRHLVMRSEVDGRPIVIKIYGPKRNLPRTLLWQVGHRVLVGKSSVLSRGRRATERETLELWRAQGFDVPEVIDARLPAAFPRPHLVLEWIDGPSLEQILADPARTAAEKVALLGRFVDMWAKRHDRALRLGEPRLVHEHPTFAHLLVTEDRLVHFDFEIVYTARHPIERLVSFEILGFLRSLAKATHGAYPSLLEEILVRYPVRARLERVSRDVLGVGRPLREFLVYLDRRLRARKSRFNKYVILRSLEAALAGEPVCLPEAQEAAKPSAGGERAYEER